MNKNEVGSVDTVHLLFVIGGTIIIKLKRKWMFYYNAADLSKLQISLNTLPAYVKNYISIDLFIEFIENFRVGFKI
jgi:hypothetical protein